ncbi:ATP-binding protein, partial [bacterium]|nr:ATP-binding protein [bacterium]
HFITNIFSIFLALSLSNMLSPNIYKIELIDIQELIDRQTVENNQLEFKQELSIDRPSDKKEFLYDVNSFANSNGADIIYGLSEDKKGVAKEITPLKITDQDAFIRKLESIVIGGFSPRLIAFQTRLITVVPNQFILILRIPPRADDLYQVAYESSGKYFIRLNNSKHQLKSEEIKNIILQLQSFKTERIQFVKNRLASINVGDMHAKLQYPAKVILTIIPQNTFAYDSTCPFTTEEAKNLPPLGGGSRTPSTNFIGMLSTAQPPGLTFPVSYIQLYQNGIIETVNTYILEPYGNNRWIRCKELEGYIVRDLSKYIEFYQKNDISFPAYIYLTLTGIKGYTIGFEGVYWYMNEPTKYDMDQIELPEIKINDYTQDIPPTLKKWFDKIWNAGGKARSLNYDANGKWIDPKI